MEQEAMTHVEYALAKFMFPQCVRPWFSTALQFKTADTKISEFKLEETESNEKVIGRNW
jgi:hypothetical protein